MSTKIAQPESFVMFIHAGHVFTIEQPVISLEPAVKDTLVNMANALRAYRKGSLVRIATGLRIVSAKNRAVFERFPLTHTRPCASQC